MAIVWGSVVGSGNNQARIGINVTVTNTSNTQSKRVTEIWFWSKYAVSDTGNTFYYNDNASSATTSKGSVSISTSVNSGEGWSTSNQKRIASYTYTFTRGTSASTRPVSAKLSGIDVIGGTMYASTTYTIPALPSYKVSYNANGGSGAPSAQTKYYGKTLTLSSTKPTRSGYTFVGWGISASDTTPNYSAGGSYTANTGATLYAIWKKSITLSYNNNGGSGSPSSQTATVYNATTSYKFTLSSTKPTRSGYTFLGWSTSNTATSASYSAGGTITLSSDDILYAIWEKTITLSYNANGGSGVPSEQSVTVYNATTNYKFTISSTKPTRTGYDFLGWSTSANGTVSYAPGDSITLSTGDTLYAVWLIKEYTVSYNANGGTGVPSNQIKTYGTNLTLSSTLPTRSGYRFLGWSTSDTGSVDYTPGATYSANSPITLYAVWERLGILHINMNGTWGSGRVWINDNGTWKTGIVFQKVNGTWKQGGA